MITITKQVSITIDGDDIEILSNICEFARIHIATIKRNHGITTSDDSRLPALLGSNNFYRVNDINNFLEKIFDI